MLEHMDRIPIGETNPDDEPGNVVPLRGSTGGEPEGAAADEEEMSYEEALAADLRDPQDEEEQPGSSIPGAGIAGLLEQGMRVGAGMFSAGATAFADALRASMPETDRAAESGQDPAATLIGAGLGAAVTATEAAATAAADAADAMAPVISWIIDPKFAKQATEVAGGATRVLDGQWKAAQAETLNAASSFLSVLVPEIVKGVMDQVDLTAMVRERVDVNAIVEDVDLDRIMERVDIDAVVAKVDMDAIIDRVDVQRVIGTVDLNEVVDGVDIERIVERVDIISIVDRLDLAAIAQEVIDDVDLPAIVRESSGAMASESVQTVRVQSMNADRLVSRIVDKVLRREARDLDPPQET
jgi:hypothetical protein